MKVPPFTTIFIGAVVGGLLAVIVAPERVTAFAGAEAGTPTWLALIKGVWLALASGYKSSHRRPGYRSTRLTWWDGEHAEYDLADHHGAWLSGEWWRRQVSWNGSLRRFLDAAKSVGIACRISCRLGPRHEHRNGGSVHRDCAARTNVQERLRGSQPSPGRAIADDWCFRHAHVSGYSMEQLRGLHGRDFRRRHAQLRAVRDFQSG